MKISGLRHNLCYLYKSISCNETLRFEMKFSILQNISIFLLLLLLSLHVCCGIEVCEQNSHIRCLHYDALTLCTVTGTDGTVVSQGILSCSVQSFIQIDFSAVTNIEVDLRINSSGTVSLTSNAMPTVILLSASSVSNSVTSLLQSVVIFNFTNSPNFTGFFPNLDAVQFTNPIYSNIPTFVHNDKLTSIVVQGAYLPVGGDFAISSGFIGGLTRLRMFSWTDSSITSIVPGAFSNLDQLSSLKLSDNKITHLRQYSFQGTHLPFLYYLWLSGNNISRVDNLAFDDLVLNQLYLDNNPFFPLESLANISSLQSLTLANNGYSYLSPDLIYNLDFHSFNLANNPFNCSCALQWANIAQIFITFNQAICAYPSEFNGVSITDPAPYVNCTQVLSYQCFNHSILCKGSSQCTNTPTTAYCSCSHVGENYAYSQLALDCVFLIDECEEANDCAQICIDTIDSYECACTQGYNLVEGFQCSDVDECLSNNGFCQQECINIVSSYECGCFEGFVLDTNTTCIDINECSDNNGGCQQECINTNSSYICGCHDGYQKNVNNTCVDIDECQTDVCAEVCVNTVGSYECECFPGFEMATNAICVDVNECSIDNGNCEQECTNTNGSYICGCHDGYQKNVNNTCVDIDECQTDVCAEVCVNTVGSYECECFPGFEKLNGSDSDTVCKDINECAIGRGGCEQYCFNTRGSSYCACFLGYEMNTAVNRCIDIDECTENNPCDQHCINNIGGYTCICFDDYVKVAHGPFVTCELSSGVMLVISRYLMLCMLAVLLLVLL